MPTALYCVVSLTSHCSSDSFSLSCLLCKQACLCSSVCVRGYSLSCSFSGQSLWCGFSTAQRALCSSRLLQVFSLSAGSVYHAMMSSHRINMWQSSPKRTRIGAIARAVLFRGLVQVTICGMRNWYDRRIGVFVRAILFRGLVQVTTCRMRNWYDRRTTYGSRTALYSGSPHTSQISHLLLYPSLWLQKSERSSHFYHYQQSLLWYVLLLISNIAEKWLEHFLSLGNPWQCTRWQAARAHA